MLSKQPVQKAPKLNEDKLKELIFSIYKRRAKKIWESITEPKVNTTLLEEAVKKGDQAFANLVDSCIEVPEVSYSRIRREWSKADHERAVIFGIQTTV